MTHLNLLPHTQMKRQPSSLVTHFDDELQSTISTLVHAMGDLQALCLAAPQVGIDKAIFVLSPSEISDSQKVFINPNIVHQSGETSYVSNCLHFGGLDYTLKRPKSLELTYLDETGQEKQFIAHDGLASIIAYQIDCLKGILVTDHMSKLKRDRFLKKYDRIMAHQPCGEACDHDHH